MKTRYLRILFVLGLGMALALFVISSQAATPARTLLRPGNPVIHPAANTHTAPPNTTVSITYDEPINPATVSTRTFAVHAMQTGLLTDLCHPQRHYQPDAYPTLQAGGTGASERHHRHSEPD